MFPIDGRIRPFLSALIYSIIFSVHSYATDLRVLVLPSGGATGIIPAVLLAHIEEQTGNSITELVHEFWGTSAGAITAALLTTPDPKTAKPYRSALEVVSFFETNFSSHLKARAIPDTLTNEVGQNFAIKDTRPTVRILTAAAHPSEKSRLNLFKNYSLFDFSSDGRGTSSYPNASLGTVVTASANVYPYVYFFPTEVPLNATETTSAIDPASFYGPGVGDPTGYFLRQIIDSLKAEDTLSVYFFGNAFIQSTHYGEIHRLLKLAKKSYLIQSDRWIEASHGSAPPQIRILNISIPVDVNQFLEDEWIEYFDQFSISLVGWVLKKSMHLTKFSISSFYSLSSFLIGHANADYLSYPYNRSRELLSANLIAAGMASSRRLKMLAEEIIQNSETFRSVLSEFKQIAADLAQTKKTPKENIIPPVLL